MSGKISVKDKAAVDSGITDYGTQKEAVTTIGGDLKADLDALAAALGIEVDGEGAEGDIPAGLGDGAKTRADSVATSLGTLATGWKDWVNGLDVIQEAAATSVTQQGGDAPAPAPKPAETKPTSPAAAPAGTPAAFAMK